jgi:hypothetical protein
MATSYPTPAVYIPRRHTPPPAPYAILPNAVRRTLRTHVVPRLPGFLQAYIPAPGEDRAYREWRQNLVKIEREAGPLTRQGENTIKRIIHRDAEGVAGGHLHPAFANYLKLYSQDSIIINMTKLIRYAYARATYGPTFADNLYFYEAREGAVLNRDIIRTGLVDLPEVGYTAIPVDAYTPINARTFHIFFFILLVQHIHDFGSRIARSIVDFNPSNVSNLFTDDFLREVATFPFIWWTTHILRNYMYLSPLFSAILATPPVGAAAAELVPLPLSDMGEIDNPPGLDALTHEPYTPGERVIVIKVSETINHIFNEIMLRQYWRSHIPLLKNPLTNAALESILKIKYARIRAAPLAAPRAAVSAAPLAAVAPASPLLSATAAAGQAARRRHRAQSPHRQPSTGRTRRNRRTRRR